MRPCLTVEMSLIELLFFLLTTGFPCLYKVFSLHFIREDICIHETIKKRLYFQQRYVHKEIKTITHIIHTLKLQKQKTGNIPNVDCYKLIYHRKLFQKIVFLVYINQIRKHCLELHTIFFILLLKVQHETQNNVNYNSLLICYNYCNCKNEI